ncbi:MAG: 16S rRNA (cytosine(1402)-N(4))-methyltransferase [Candidatus Peribacteria bacterium]|nr:MAG: 16S rRNA (cytosine(1402)-N(4))-methyltransferase [Candidatus Peribacteria bacterium]
MLLDIGINRGHIWDAERGFSIKADGPLDMRFDSTSNGMTAEQYLQRMDVQDFSAKLQQYGDFSPARAEQIALHIARSRSSQPITTTLELVDVLREIKLDGRKQAIIFQVLRIVVNDELGHLERFLESFGDHLTP